MPPSYRKVNYSLRPGKCVERKMLCETFRRLTSFATLEDYYYIGFGSTYFSDFSLFHKSLNITRMSSIERDTFSKERFIFNRPFKCIEIHFGESNSILPGLSWQDSRTISWLDYDGKLDSNVLSDINTVFSSALSGSVVLLSVNAKPSKPGDRLKDLRRRLIDENKIPTHIREKDLSGWGMAKVCREIINNEIEETIIDRNGGIDPDEKLTYKQLFNFHYKDGSEEMLTVGGIVYSQRESQKLEDCNFYQLDFIKSDSEPYTILVPNLTYREIRFLDTHLPIPNVNSVSLPGVPSSDIESYVSIYRYFPTFAEAEF
jgi:hypothetical protein